MAEFGIRGVEFLGSATREVVFIHKTYNKLLDELSYSSAERRSCTASWFISALTKSIKLDEVLSGYQPRQYEYNSDVSETVFDDRVSETSEFYFVLTQLTTWEDFINILMFKKMIHIFLP